MEVNKYLPFSFFTSIVYCFELFNSNLFFCVQTCEQRHVSHFQYLSWPDYGVPTSAVTLIDFLGAVKKQQRKMMKALGSQWTGHPLGPPMVVHCSAGIGRTGNETIV